MISTPRRASWLSLLLAGIGAFLAAFVSVFVIVLVYSSILAFQARGAPDQAAIQAFANSYSPLLSDILLPLFALFFSFLVLRRRAQSPVWYGLIIGAVAGLPSLILSGQIDLASLFSVVLPIAGGFLGALLATRTGSARPKAPPDSSGA